MDDEITRKRLDRIDEKICADRALYLKAYWKGSIDCDAWEAEVDRLLDLRTLLQRGLLTNLQIAEVDAL